MLPYAATIFLSAFQLFLVQPLIAKQILPWFGGSAAVWTTCMLFFQTILLLGYAYAHATVRWLKPRTQVILHLVLLAVSLIWLPVAANPRFKPTGNEDPIPRILALLVLGIGLPYLLLSATTPLMQAWFWRQRRSAIPYRLFALSNFASLLALLGYPTLIEPRLGARHVALLWSALYALFVLVCGATGLLTLRGGAAAPQEEEKTAEDGPAAAPMTVATTGLVLLLSALGSALLLTVTNHMTQDVPPVPFLWVLPLALYLITFIICFDKPAWYKRWIFIPLLWAAASGMIWRDQSLENLPLTAGIYASGLFVGCMFCHGEISRMRPDPRHLTRYYLVISLGGAMGALAIAILAPLTLKGAYEIHITLGVLLTLVLLRMIGAFRAADAPMVEWAKARRRLKILGEQLVRRARARRVLAAAPVVGSVLGVAAFGYFTYVDMVDYHDEVVLLRRDFYGVIRIVDHWAGIPVRRMYHGAIMHGSQILEPQYVRDPTSYFCHTSGYGVVFGNLPEEPRKVGVIGLGAGALASYARPGDDWVFYELAPNVAKIAMKDFTFVSGSPAKTEIVLGDGRLALEREAPRNYDLIAVDAFSGDSIPMHLITREAFAVYLKHLKPDGVMVFQATNRYVDIVPVVHRLADLAGYTTRVVDDVPDDKQRRHRCSASYQVIVTKSNRLLESPTFDRVAEDATAKPTLETFTDDYYSLWDIVDLPK